jgi:hypothetical protein
LKIDVETNLGSNSRIGRNPRGNKKQLRSDTALFGNLAYRLEGVPVAGLQPWAAKLGIDVGVDALRKSPRGAARLEGASDPSAAVRKSLAIDWAELNFFSAAVRLRLHGREYVDRLEGVPGVVDLYLLEGDLALLIVIFERLHDKQDLESGLSAFGELKAWEEVNSHRSGAVLRTSRALARQAAARENLLPR